MGVSQVRNGLIKWAEIDKVEMEPKEVSEDDTLIKMLTRMKAKELLSQGIELEYLIDPKRKPWAHPLAEYPFGESLECGMSIEHANVCGIDLVSKHYFIEELLAFKQYPISRKYELDAVAVIKEVISLLSKLDQANKCVIHQSREYSDSALKNTLVKDFYNVETSFAGEIILGNIEVGTASFTMRRDFCRDLLSGYTHFDSEFLVERHIRY